MTATAAPAKTTYILEAFSRREDGVVGYHRSFTTSPRNAQDFAEVPSFVDEGCMVEFRVREHQGGKRGKRLAKIDAYIEQELAIIRTRRTKDGALAVAALENAARRSRAVKPTAANSTAAQFVDSTMIIQLIGEETAAGLGITRESIKTQFLNPDDIRVEKLNQGVYEQFISFRDGSDAAKVRGSKRWEVWR